MELEGHQVALTIPTAMPGLKLVSLTQDDAPDYYRLIDRNRDHVTRHGDYSDVKQATLESVVRDLGDLADRNLKFGIWLEGTLIGRVDLSPRVPGHFVIGYWLGSAYTGSGFATMACKALIQYGQEWLGATAIFAGVTKGNGASEALLGRLGFKPMEDRGSYTLFRLALSGNESGRR